MARKKTGRPRGRPKGSRRYPGDDPLCIEIALLILTRQVEKVQHAAKQMAPRGEGGLMSALASKKRRLERNYQKREQWFIEQAKVRLAASRPPRRAPRSGIATYLDNMSAIQQFVDSQQRYKTTVKQFADSQRRLAEAGAYFCPTRCELMSE
jgi:hypothetical protein